MNNMNTFSTSNYISTLSTSISTFILNRYNINMMYFPVIQEGLLRFFKMFDNFSNFDYTKFNIFKINSIYSSTNFIYNIINYNILFVIIFVVIFIILYIKYFKTNNDTIIYEFTTYTTFDLNILYSYIDSFPQHFPNLKKYTNGNLKDLVNQQMNINKQSSTYEKYIPIEKSNIQIEIENVCSGYIYFDNYQEEKSETIEKEGSKKTVTHNIIIPYCILKFKKILLQDFTPKKFINYLNDAINNHLTEKSKIKLFQRILFDYSLDCETFLCTNTIIYYGYKKSLEEKKSEYIDSLFHEKKEELWNNLYKINYEPEFFTKLGQIPRMGLILHGPPGTGKSSFAYRMAMALDRHLYIINLKIIKTKKTLFDIFNAPFIGHTCRRPKEVIIVFDEFDFGIKYLYNKEKQRQKQINELENILISNSNDENNISLKEIDDKRKNMEDELCLHDLLDIFQGIVPTEGLICIATTNDIETIKELCPPLVRPGRLTPYHFGYPSLKIINEISNYYFNENLNLLDYSYDIIVEKPTSQIIEIALSCKMDDKLGLEHFKSEIIRLIHE